MLRARIIQNSDEHFDPGFPIFLETGEIRVNLTYIICSLDNLTK